jgi:putative PEP-CTERM system histidine kinase
MNLGIFSYLGATVAFAFFTILLSFSLRSLQGRMLFGVVTTSTVWAALAVKITTHEADGGAVITAYQAFEVLRYIAWYVFLLRLFDPAASQATAQAESFRKFVKLVLPVSVVFAGMVMVNDVFDLPDAIPSLQTIGIIGHIFLALFGLAIIEQLLRNTSSRHLWAIKYLFIGTGGIFAFDFYLYADALLFRGIDQSLWEARGIINLIAVPLLAISSARNKNWSLNIFVSRDIVLNTTAILGGGLYLLMMAAAGYYLREFGGTWGRFGQLVFFSLAIALLAAVLLSGQLRARIRVFLVKHFYRNKYDYRLEWLRLTGELSNNAPGEARFEAVIEALAQIVDAHGGSLWLRDDLANFSNTAVWRTTRLDTAEPGDSRLIRFLETSGFVINLTDLESHPDEYKGLVLPEWLASISRPWLIVPLFSLDSLLGFIVLANPLIVRSINWEDRDLLKAAAKQVSSHLTVLRTSDALAEAKQFEVFSRLSAYMVHDLKNIAAELELVARNAKKHISNPVFVEDAFDTVENAASDIKRLLEQLRNRRVQNEKKVTVDLGALIQTVVESKQASKPKPRLEKSCNTCFVAAEKNRLANVLAHLIDNAQQATADDGVVEVALVRDADMHVIQISDSGHGMDADFIRTRLFKPFDTTKGNAGMGIGMYESREFVRGLGGKLNVRSEPGKGTTISLQIPVSAESSDALSVDI